MTLLEIMIVLALISLIAGATGMTVIHRFKEGQLRATQLQVRQLVGDGPAAPHHVQPVPFRG